MVSMGVWLRAGLGEASGLDFFVGTYLRCGGSLYMYISLSSLPSFWGITSGEGDRSSSGMLSSRYFFSASRDCLWAFCMS